MIPTKKKKVNEKVIRLFEEVLSEQTQLGYEELLLCASLKSQSGVTVFEQEVDSVEISDEIKIGIYVGLEGRFAASSIESLDSKVLKASIEKSLLASRYSDRDEAIQLAPQIKTELKSYTPDPQILEIPMELLKERAKSLESQLSKGSSLIQNIPYSFAAIQESTQIIANSHGMMHSQSGALSMAGVSAMAQGNDARMIEIYESDQVTQEQDFDLDRLAQRVLDEVKSRVEPKKIDSGDYTVILDPQCAAQLLRTFFPVFSGDYLLRDMTKLKGQLGKNIADSRVTIMDSPSEGLIKTAVDGEGSPSYAKALIENGIFKNFVHNLYSAQRSGAQTTGNASLSLGSAPDIQSLNLFWQPGNKSSSELCSHLERALYIKDLVGASASPISGDFSYGASGYLIESGQRSYAVSDFTLAGNFFDLLKNIKDLANDLKFYSPHSLGSYGGVSLLIEGLSVSS